MFEVYELITPVVAGVLQPPCKAHFGVGVTLAHAVQQAASTITAESEGLIDHVSNLKCLELYMQHTGTILHFAYRGPIEQRDPVAAYKLP